MLQTFLVWLAKLILGMIASRVETEISQHVEQAKKDAADEKINQDNAKKYEDAKSRQERIKAATDLLNGTSSP